MTAPQPASLPLSALQLPVAPYVPPGCTARGCGTQRTETLDRVHGRRCAQHPPTFLRERVRDLLLDGFPDAALAYARAEGLA